MRRENPFSPSFPVNPRYFVNREEVVDSFKKAFDRSTKTEFPTPDNIAILGDWKDLCDEKIRIHSQREGKEDFVRDGKTSGEVRSL